MLSSKHYKQFSCNDVSIPPEWIYKNRILPGDSIHVTATEVILLERAPKKSLIGILELTGKYQYGLTSRGIPLYLCQPLDTSYPAFRVACKEKDKSANLYIQFQFESWEDGSALPRGALQRILGPVEEKSVEFEALACSISPWTLPKSPPPSLKVKDVPDFSTGTFNIDPPGCKDIDDVLTIIQKSNELYEIWITIADVAEYISYFSLEDITAYKLAATLYQNGQAVKPMLPRVFSEEICSLLPGQKRRGISYGFLFDTTGNIQDLGWKSVTLINNESYTYESIYQSKTVPLEILQSFVSTLAGRQIKDSHEWIEVCMITYNQKAAELILKTNQGCLRIHDAPCQSLCNSLKEIDPSLEVLGYSSAQYTTTNNAKIHWAIGTLYTHASSPLRRYADLVNQRVIKSSIENKPMSPWKTEDMALYLNKRQKEIKAHDRDVFLIEALYNSETNKEPLQAWVLENTNEKGKTLCYIQSWKQILKLKLGSEPLKKGMKIELHYTCDRRKARWKDRILFSNPCILND
jgi:exoribonuclease R